MASSKTETQIQWSAADSRTVNSGSIAWSDAFALNVEDWEAEILLSADNQGTPANGDVADFYIGYTSGDILGGGGDDFPTDEHAEFLARLDTYGSNTPGEDPARCARPVRTSASGFRIGVICPQAGTRNIVVRARVVTHRGQ
jgi:hypothetical protein